MKDRQREDKTWTVFIRFTHNRKVRYISTSLCAAKKDLTASMKIKNQSLLDKCDEIIKNFRSKISSLCLELNPMDIDDVVSHLTASIVPDDKIDFVSFCYKWFDMNKSTKGLKNYISALNSFCYFFGRNNIYCSEITSNKLREYERFLGDKERAKSLYTSSICKMFNEAMLFYNDEEMDIIRIKNTIKGYKPPKQNVAQKRSLHEDTIKAIFNLPYKGGFCRRDLAKDCFILSFCMMGTNSADLFSLNKSVDGFVIYNRQKTRERRFDKALMKVKLHPIIQPILDRYLDDELLLNFHRRYKNYIEFNRAINIGLKEIQKELGLDKLQYYYARHSMATIAVNKAGIDKYTVNDMLCHTDSSMRVTDLYIEKDFTPMNEANYKLIEYVFGEYML